jgi:hypothetical protein
MKVLNNNHKALLFTSFVVLYFALVLFVHLLMQNNDVHYLFRKILPTYEVSLDESWNKTITNSNKPFEKITSEKMTVWDGSHYNFIKEEMYSDIKNFAYYPLFPLFWKVTGLSTLGISLLNILLFAVGMLLMFKIFSSSLSFKHLFLLLCVPYMVIFMMPYSEGLYFLFISLGLYGILKEKYWIYFLGFLLASMTKSSSLLFVILFLCLEGLNALNHRSVSSFFKRFLKAVLPVVLGMFLVMTFQWIMGAPSFFQSIISQKYWGKSLSLPQLPFSFWSNESRSITVPFLCLYFLPMLVVLAREVVLALSSKRRIAFDKWKYVRLICIVFLVGNVFTALFTQHGGLYSLARYLLATPFFVFLLFDTINRKRNIFWQMIYIAIGVITIIICRDYFEKADFFGTYLVIVSSIFCFFHHKINPKILYPLLAIIILLNVCWTAYMFNCFLLNGWIFT